MSFKTVIEQNLGKEIVVAFNDFKPQVTKIYGYGNGSFNMKIGSSLRFFRAENVQEISEIDSKLKIKIQK